MNYRKQVSLLLSVLPEVAKEKSFALHGGTAINLFVRNMPRLSVDVDLTYIPVEDRATSLENIQAALRRIKERIELAIKDVRITDRSADGKLLVSFHEIVVKIEVNLVARGTVDEPKGIALCSLAQGEFDAFCVMPVVPIGQLFGGKICAALDRQHPRDLFDVKHLLENEGFSDEIKSGFLLALISSERPIHEVIDPHLLDQQSVLENHFTGMSNEVFPYQDFEETRTKLLSTIDERLTDEDRSFLLSIKGLEPDWNRYDFEKFPAVQWKLLNLRRLKDSNPNKYLEQYEALKSKLEK
ncbi:MAG: nucleotidyl transferase AbiEii/AbiGii toxin family protein [Acidobacteriota bacterium]|nr:MAG: nucleotidyl transferase AbiEii/AbiGii toxin family protein [Acidobacteriota bacterium]